MGLKSQLARLLEKRGIKREELSKEEETQFKQWELTLSGGEVTVGSIRDFCNRMVDVIETKWRDFEYQNKEKLLPYHGVYKAILGIIDGPKVERENLEKYLNQLIEQ